MIKIKCKNCGKEVKVTPHRFDTTENICCSNQCRYEYRRKNNDINYILKNDHCEMIIKDKIIKIDLEDIEKVQKYTWYVNKGGYVYTSIQIGRKNKRGVYHNILLHRYIMNVENSIYPLVDHINRDILDNRKNNLRLANYQTNVLNSSLRKDNKTGYKCVFLNKQTGKYYSQVRRNGKINYLGSTDTLEQAKQLYVKWVLEDGKDDANTL
jgi:hypothetical protein